MFILWHLWICLFFLVCEYFGRLIKWNTFHLTSLAYPCTYSISRYPYLEGLNYIQTNSSLIHKLIIEVSFWHQNLFVNTAGCLLSVLVSFLGPSSVFPAGHSGPRCSQRPACWSHGSSQTADGDLLPDVCPDGDWPQSRDCPLQHASRKHQRHRCKGRYRQCCKTVNRVSLPILRHSWWGHYLHFWGGKKYTQNIPLITYLII